jgi:hypothetical protein
VVFNKTYGLLNTFCPEFLIDKSSNKIIRIGCKGPIMSVFSNQEKEGWILSYEHGSPDEHIKDALYKDHSVVPAEYGEGKIKGILMSLQNRGYEGFLLLEPHLGAFSGLSALEHDSKIADLPEGGPKTFDIAVKALKEILSEITIS